MATQVSPADREQQLADVLLEYVEAAERGQPPDRRQFMEVHPELADELAEFFMGRDRIERAAGRLRQLAGAGPVTHIRPPQGVPAPSPRSDPLSEALTTPHAPVVLTAPEPGYLGDYQLLREIGRGGMGIVYEAHQLSLNRRVALKVLPFAAALDQKHLQRFKNEAQAAAQLHHSNIVPVYAVGCERGVHYYAMQFIEGQSLAAIISELQENAGPRAIADVNASPAEAVLAQSPSLAKAIGEPADLTACYTPPAPAPLSPAASVLTGNDPTPHGLAHSSTDRSLRSQAYFRRAAELGMRAAEALEHAHQLGVIHRDVKPANLLVDVRGNLWITDFGLALFKSDSGLTMTGELLGTLRYMSPEQTFARRGLVDHRTDVYSLGATLYELLTLEQLFSGQDREELLHHIAHEEPRPPRSVNDAIPVELETIILKALAKNPAERYASAQDLADDLQRFLLDRPILAKRPTLVDKARKWARRHRAVVVCGVVMLALSTIGLAAATCVIAREEARTRAAYAKAVDERNRAETSFQQAREAVDFFAEVAKDDMKKPGMERVRKKLLEGALGYYETFAKEHRDNPSIHRELVTSYTKAAHLMNELGSRVEAMAYLDKARQMQEEWLKKNPGCSESHDLMACIERDACKFHGCEKLSALAEKPIQQQLQLSAKQLRLIDEQKRRLSKQLHETYDIVVKLQPADQQKALQEIAKACEQTALAALSTTQIQQFRRIRLQMRGAQALFDPDVSRILQLSAQQRQTIAAILDAESDKAPAAEPSPTYQHVVHITSEDGQGSLVHKLLRVLTPAQRARWQQMLGESSPGDLF